MITRVVVRLRQRRGRKVGIVMPLNDPGGFLGKTDEQVRDIVQSTVRRASNQLPSEDQRAIARGDVCVVVAQQWARSKQGNEAWIRLVGVLILH